jgi:hypothetical protein
MNITLVKKPFEVAIIFIPIQQLRFSNNTNTHFDKKTNFKEFKLVI